MENRSILSIIKDNMTDKGLPDDFSLGSLIASNDNNSFVKFADGALDGMTMYHMGRSELTDEGAALIEKAFSLLDDTQGITDTMKELFAKLRPISAIDYIQQYVMQHTETLSANAVHSYAVQCLDSGEVDIVKLGLILTELFVEKDENVKDKIRTLGLSDEFTIFCVFNMLNWENGNDEIFRLAQKVHGWGRIHAVERLDPVNSEIKEWLLREGIDNRVMSEYSAPDVYEKADIRQLLAGDMTDEQTDEIAAVLGAMFAEGPVRGISGLDDDEAKEIVDNFISQAEKHKGSLEVYRLIHTIADDKRFKHEKKRCEAILESPICREIIERALDEGDGTDLAKALNIPYKEKIFAHLKRDFEKGYNNVSLLIADDGYRDEVIEIFRRDLPLDDMKSEDYNRLFYLTNAVTAYPLCGEDLLAAMLDSPTSFHRINTLNIIAEWCGKKRTSLKDISDLLYNTVTNMKNTETDEEVKKKIAKFDFMNY